MKASVRGARGPILNVLALGVSLTFSGAAFSQTPVRFLRGDADVNRFLDLNDAITTLGYLYLAEPTRLLCDDAADANDDGLVNLTDPVSVLFFLFEGDAVIPEPVGACGTDQTADSLSCESFWPCGTGAIENAVQMKLVPVAPGQFQMGSPPSERGRFPEEVLHTVELTCGFYMGATEVTQGQYVEVMGDNPSYVNGVQSGHDFGTDLNRPVDQVSWFDATEFCRRLSEKEGRRYRLPYEAEWEYACRAGSTTRFWFGDLLECDDETVSDPPECPNATGYMLLPNELQYPTLLTVAQKKPNPWGLYDMHGLSAEWCQDWYGPYPKGPVVNPTGPPAGREKLVRGSQGQRFGLRYMRSAIRGRIGPGANVYNSLGFRVVLELPGCRYGYD